MHNGILGQIVAAAKKDGMTLAAIATETGLREEIIREYVEDKCRNLFDVTCASTSDANTYRYKRKEWNRRVSQITHLDPTCSGCGTTLHHNVMGNDSIVFYACKGCAAWTRLEVRPDGYINSAYTPGTGPTPTQMRRRPVKLRQSLVEDWLTR